MEGRAGALSRGDVNLARLSGAAGDSVGAAKSGGASLGVIAHLAWARLGGDDSPRAFVIRDKICQLLFKAGLEHLCFAQDHILHDCSALRAGLFILHLHGTICHDVTSQVRASHHDTLTRCNGEKPKVHRVLDGLGWPNIAPCDNSIF